MALRVFMARCIVAIDENDALENEQREASQGSVTLDELRDYLKDAVSMQLNDEDHGNPVGVRALEVHWDTLNEMQPNAVKELFGQG